MNIQCKASLHSIAQTMLALALLTACGSRDGGASVAGFKTTAVKTSNGSTINALRLTSEADMESLSTKTAYFMLVPIDKESHKITSATVDTSCDKPDLRVSNGWISKALSEGKFYSEFSTPIEQLTMRGGTAQCAGSLGFRGQSQYYTFLICKTDNEWDEFGQTFKSGETVFLMNYGTPKEETLRSAMPHLLIPCEAPKQ
jgi:hypothetical protein